MQPQLGMLWPMATTARQLCKACANLKYSLKAITQSVQAFGDLLTRMAGQFLGACCPLDAGMIPASTRTLTKGEPSSVR